MAPRQRPDAKTTSVRRRRWTEEELARISYRDPEFLAQFLTARGRIRGRPGRCPVA